MASAALCAALIICAFNYAVKGALGHCELQETRQGSVKSLDCKSDGNERYCDISCRYRYPKNPARFYCSSDGSWEYLPKCVKVKEFCTVPAVTNGVIGRPQFKELTVGEIIDEREDIYLRCDTNYNVAGESENDIKISCTNGKWAVEPSCIPEVFCDHPVASDRDAIDSAGGRYTVGSTLIFLCSADRKLIGSLTAKCLSTGEWSSPVPECVDICTVPAIENGVIGFYKNAFRRTQFSKMIVGEKIEDQEDIYLRCNQNYEVAGESKNEIKISCTNGRWAVQPTCVPVATCSIESLFESLPEGVVPINAEVTDEPMLYGSILNLECNLPKMHVVGDNTAKCDHTGKWKIDNVKCEIDNVKWLNDNQTLATCSIESLFESLPEGVVPIIAEVTGEPMPYGSILILECNPPNQDFTVITTAKCGHNGNWEIDNGKCESDNGKGKLDNVKLVTCTIESIFEILPAGVVPIIAEVTGEPMLYGSVLNLECNLPKMHVVGESTAKCDHTGKWEIDNVKCEIDNAKWLNDNQTLMHCSIESLFELLPQGVVPDIAEVSSENMPHGAILNLKCNLLQMHIVGDSTAKCNDTGKWEIDNVKCEIDNAKVVFCSIDSLFEVLPEDVAPEIAEVSSENMAYGTTLNLTCNRPHFHVMGDRTANCSHTGQWEIGNVKCIRGCLLLAKPKQSDVLIYPQKVFYRLGELVTLSCPPNRSLTMDVEVLMCLGNGWSSKFLPDCHDTQYEHDLNDG